MSIHEPDDAGKIALFEGPPHFILHGKVLSLAGKRMYSAVHDMGAEVESGETDSLPLPGDRRSDGPHPQLGLAGSNDAKIFPAHQVTVDGGLFGVLLEKRADRIVGADADQVEHGGPDLLLVYEGTVAELRDVAPCRAKPLPESFFETHPEVVLGQLDRPPRILEDLNGLYS